MYIFGQICGIIGTIITIVRPQFKSKERIFLCTLIVNGLSALNYGCVEGIGSAVFLCLIAIVQSAVSIVHVRRDTEITKWEMVLLFILYMGAGFCGMVTSAGFVWGINAHNLLELLPIIGALLLMLSVFAKTEQKTRAFLFCNGAVWAVYCAIIGTATFFTSVAAMVSAAVAMWKNRGGNTTEANV